MCFGRISLVNLGDSNERVRRSSGGTLGAVKLEKDLAADFKACNDAVRLDLKDLKRSVDAAGGVTISAMSSIARSSQSSGLKCSNGWSKMQSSFGGDETTFSRRSVDAFLYDSGVLSPSQFDAKEGASISKDGGMVDKESLDIDLDVMEVAIYFSCSTLTRLPYSSSTHRHGPRAGPKASR